LTKKKDAIKRFQFQKLLCTIIYRTYAKQLAFYVKRKINKMTIGRNILSMSAAELSDFVRERQAARHEKACEAITKRKKKQTPAQLAKDLGVSVDEVVKLVEKELHEKA
jgi:hypothetical protein